MKAKKLSCFVLLLILFLFGSLWAQQTLSPPLKHQKKVYVSPDHHVYLPGRTTPLYLRLSTSPDSAAESYLLFNEKSYKEAAKTGKPLMAAPFFMENEGKHSVIHPSSKYWKTKSVSPEALLTPDRIFYIFVDESSPVSKKLITSAPNIKDGKITIYGEPISFQLKSSDNLSGVKTTYYSVNGAAFAPYSAEVAVDKEGAYNLRYYAVDHVGNAEKLTTFLFDLDLTPPTTEHAVKNIHKGDILSPRALLKLTSTDNRSGVKKVSYAFDSGREKTYLNRAIPVALLSDGNHTFTYYARDKVKNVETKKSYSFYLDKIPPEVKANIVGDQHKKAGKLFVSGRSKVQLTAKDNKSGVQKIRYLVDAHQTETYADPFLLPATSGSHSVQYFAIDDVENVSPKKMLTMTLDLTAPRSSSRYVGANVLVQDTIYIAASTKIKLNATDKQAGVRQINYQVDGGSVNAYSAPFTIKSHGAHKVDYFSTDMVNNREKARTIEFFVDTMGPEIYHHFSIETSRKTRMKKVAREADIYPVGTKLYLGATDKHSGVKTIYYRINKGKKLIYRRLLPFKTVGEYVVAIEAVDQVGNVSRQSVEFVIKNIPPTK